MRTTLRTNSAEAKLQHFLCGVRHFTTGMAWHGVPKKTAIFSFLLTLFFSTAGYITRQVGVVCSCACLVMIPFDPLVAADVDAHNALNMSKQQQHSYVGSQSYSNSSNHPRSYYIK